MNRRIVFLWFVLAASPASASPPPMRNRSSSARSRARWPSSASRSAECGECNKPASSRSTRARRSVQNDPRLRRERGIVLRNGADRQAPARRLGERRSGTSRSGPLLRSRERARAESRVPSRAAPVRARLRGLGAGLRLPLQDRQVVLDEAVQDGGVLRGKAWRDGEPEPADWMVSWTGFDEALERLSGLGRLFGRSGARNRRSPLPSAASCDSVRTRRRTTRKKATWQETIAASLEALARQDARRSRRPSRRSAPRRREVLWGRLRRDFSDPQSRRQMAWERQDGIWPTELGRAEQSPRWPNATPAPRGPAWPNRPANWPRPSKQAGRPRTAPPSLLPLARDRSDALPAGTTRTSSHCVWRSRT